MRAKRYFLIVTAILSSGASACFYPPMVQPSPEQRDQILLPVPYDLAWDAVNNVVKQNELKIHAQDPTHGIIEAQTPHFTLQDADCGVVGTAVGKVKAEPAADASAVYNFYLTAADRESSRLAVQAVFSTPIRVPFRPLQMLTAFRPEFRRRACCARFEIRRIRSSGRRSRSRRRSRSGRRLQIPEPKEAHQDERENWIHSWGSSN